MVNMKTKTVEYIKIDRGTAVDIHWREHSLQVAGFDADSGKGFDFELYCHENTLFNGQGYAMEQIATQLFKLYPERFKDVANEAGFVPDLTDNKETGE